ncbi:MAG: CPBP family intramembrane metalloprotease [Prolixibacteraceae bacterium]|nr:CPBP family intramembrane metalloprotease [Prolixibacteraceae bacterium]
MNELQKKHYPTILGAIHLIVLYTFIQTIIDFPLALLDYYNGTDYLYNPIKKIVLGVGSNIFIFYYAYRRAGVQLKELFPAKSFNFLILIPIVFFFWAAQNLIGEVNIALDKVLPPPSWFWELFNKIFENDYGIYGAILKVVIMAPVIEEMIFRGVIMHGLMRNNSKFTAVFISALLFALFHLNPWQFPATFVLGLVLGILMLRTRNIYLCILGHAINNGLVLISIQYWDQIQKTSFVQSDKSNQLIISALISVAALFLILLFSRERKPKGN